MSGGSSPGRDVREERNSRSSMSFVGELGDNTGSVNTRHIKEASAVGAGGKLTC